MNFGYYKFTRRRDPVLNACNFEEKTNSDVCTLIYRFFFFCWGRVKDLAEGLGRHNREVIKLINVSVFIFGWRRFRPAFTSPVRFRYLFPVLSSVFYFRLCVRFSDSTVSLFLIPFFFSFSASILMFSFNLRNFFLLFIRFCLLISLPFSVKIKIVIFTTMTSYLKFQRWLKKKIKL